MGNYPLVLVGGERYRAGAQTLVTLLQALGRGSSFCVGVLIIFCYCYQADEL